MFWHKRTNDTEQIHAITTLSQRLAIIEGRITALELGNDAFRDKVLRKIQTTHSNEAVLDKLKLTAGAKTRR